MDITLVHNLMFNVRRILAERSFMVEQASFLSHLGQINAYHCVSLLLSRLE